LPIYVPVPIKWLVRIALGGFYGAIAFYYTQGHDVFRWLFTEHPWVSLFLIYTTYVAFLVPFLKNNIKKTVGGERIMMKKTFVLICIVIAGLLFAVFYFAVPQVKAATDPGINAVKTWVVDISWGIQASPFWASYIKPFIPIYTFIGGAVCTVLIVRSVIPRMPKIQKLSRSKGTTTDIGTDQTRGTTPLGATIRPEEKTAKLVVEEPEPEETTAT